MSIDWSKYKNFSKREFDCHHTGLNRMRPEFMELLQDIRTVYNRPMVISSGYRDKTHPVEAAKKAPGAHYYGVAADILCHGTDWLELQHIAFEHGVRRFGVMQKGPLQARFLHIDIGDRGLHFPVDGWSY